MNSEKTNYVCPMHPGEVPDTPGKCSLCGMNLVEAGIVQQSGGMADMGLGEVTWKSYLPLGTVIALVVLL